MSKTALITGASGGIGYEIARVHAEHGINLILVARNKEKLEEIGSKFQEKYKISVYTIEKDLSVQGAAVEVYDEINNRGILVDHLINNAGFGDVSLFVDSNWKKLERMINLNILALTHLTRLLLPGMTERGYGRILNLASTAAFQPGPTMAVYFATKAFVLSFSEALSNEVRKAGVTVTALCPGSTESGFHAAAIDNKPPKERVLPSSGKIAEFGYRSMMKGRTVAIPGFLNNLFATSVRFFPRSLVVKTARKIQERKH